MTMGRGQLIIAPSLDRLFLHVRQGWLLLSLHLLQMLGSRCQAAACCLTAADTGCKILLQLELVQKGPLLCCCSCSSHNSAAVPISLTAATAPAVIAEQR